MSARPPVPVLVAVALVLTTAALAPAGRVHGAAPDAPARPPVPGAILRGFEPPAHPYGPGHRGVALAAPPCAAVRAAIAGQVTFAGEVAGAGWVTVAHGGGLDTTYGLLDPRHVTRGAYVAQGEMLGRLAPSAGHLHWGARLHGAYIDPLLLLARWEVHLVEVPP
jgi:murein DD-endopeptidase MepM/ murein hydrolase activator NlpD